MKRRLHKSKTIITDHWPTDIDIQDMRNSIGLSHCCLSGSSPTSSFLPASATNIRNKIVKCWQYFPWICIGHYFIFKYLPLIKLLSRNRGTFVLKMSSSFSSMSPILLGFLTILLPLRLTTLLLLKSVLTLIQNQILIVD